jgi:hypothetical protein
MSTKEVTANVAKALTEVSKMVSRNASQNFMNIVKKCDCLQELL